MKNKKMKFIWIVLLAPLVLLIGQVSAAQKPNILVIWGDDIGITNISAYTFGLVGYKTPNIDRIAEEGMMFTDYYGEQSCTAGRSSFIMGQSVFRTGLSKVGLPGAELGMRKEDPTIAGLLKAQGYVTGQFGKNHLGDKDEHLPTNHGFDEFFGNLYHLNAEEEPENPDYPKSPEFRKKFGPRGVIHSFAEGRIEDTGPLTKKRMETVDDETVAAALDFIDRQHAAGKPFFCWWNGTRMHFRTHVKKELRGISGQDEYSDGMVEHDMHVGELLDLLDEMAQYHTHYFEIDETAGKLYLRDMLLSNGQATLTDFGLVKAGEGTKLSTTGVVFGTPEYMSPEQAEGKALDAQSDVYSLGVVLFEMLAGRAPFVADTTPAVMYKHVHEPPPLDELPSGLPQGVVAVVENSTTSVTYHKVSDVS